MFYIYSFILVSCSEPISVDYSRELGKIRSSCLRSSFVSRLSDPSAGSVVSVATEDDIVHPPWTVNNHL
jgi:hypothetical protein